LLLGVVIVVMLNIPFDLAGIEPFDAYLLKAGMSATVWIALLGLCFSAIVPMGYCRYGCPTGALLKFVRSRGVNDSLGTKEVVAFLLILIAFAIARNHEYLSITFME